MDALNIASKLCTIHYFNCSGCVPCLIRVQLSTKWRSGGSLDMQGLRKMLSFTREQTTGTIHSPYGTIYFEGIRSYINRSSTVSFSGSKSVVLGKLRIPWFWGVFSISKPATLEIFEGSDFKIWMPKVQPDLTIGTLKPRGKEHVRYKLFSADPSELMFGDTNAFEDMPNESALVLLSALIYFCLYPQWVCDSGD